MLITRLINELLLQFTPFFGYIIFVLADLNFVICAAFISEFSWSQYFLFAFWTSDNFILFLVHNGLSVIKVSIYC